MPNNDGTGPDGKGPKKTNKGLPERKRDGSGKRTGRGKGLGRGQGRGRGRGRERQFNGN